MMGTCIPSDKKFFISVFITLCQDVILGVDAYGMAREDGALQILKGVLDSTLSVSPIKSKVSLVREIGDAYRQPGIDSNQTVSLERKDSFLEESGKHEVQHGPDFYNKTAARVLKAADLLNKQKEGHGLQIDQASQAAHDGIAAAQTAWAAYFYYSRRMRSLISGAWDYNDAILELHDQAINNIQAEAVEGHFPEDKENKPIILMVPMAIALEFPLGCPVLFEDSRKELEQNVIPRMVKKMETYRDKDFLVCVKARTLNSPATWDWQNKYYGTGCDKEYDTLYNELFKLPEDNVEVGHTLRHFYKQRERALVDFFDTKMGEIRARLQTRGSTVTLGKASEAIEATAGQNIQGGAFFDDYPGGAIAIAAFHKPGQGTEGGNKGKKTSQAPTNANVQSHHCIPEFFHNMEHGTKQFNKDAVEFKEDARISWGSEDDAKLGNLSTLGAGRLNIFAASGMHPKPRHHQQ